MSDDTPAPAPRRYTDQEIRAVLERAAEIQHVEPSAPDGSGLTLAQLESVAREAGIDVAAVRRAAAELDTSARDAGRGGLVPRAAGAPLGLTLTRTVPFEVPPGALDELVPLIQKASDAAGEASRAGQTLFWDGRSGTSLLALQVTVTSRGGETRIGIEETYGGLAGSIFGSGVGGIGAGVGFGVGLGVGASIGSALFMVAFPVAAIGLTYVGSRAVYTHIVGRREAALVRLADTLEQELMALAEAGRQLPAPGEPPDGGMGDEG